MKTLYTLTIYDRLDDYLQGFFIGVFSSYFEAENIGKKYLREVQGFKDYSCKYEILTKTMIGKADNPESVSIIWGWNINNNLDEVDIWQSDLYANKDEAYAVLDIVRTENRRQEWCVDTYKIGACHWQEGFVRA